MAVTQNLLQALFLLFEILTSEAKVLLTNP